MDENELLHEAHVRYENDAEFHATVYRTVNFIISGPSPIPLTDPVEIEAIRTLLTVTASVALIINSGEYL